MRRRLTTTHNTDRQKNRNRWRRRGMGKGRTGRGTSRCKHIQRVAEGGLRGKYQSRWRDVSFGAGDYAVFGAVCLGLCRKGEWGDTKTVLTAARVVSLCPCTCTLVCKAASPAFLSVVKKEKNPKFGQIWLWSRTSVQVTTYPPYMKLTSITASMTCMIGCTNFCHTIWPQWISHFHFTPALIKQTALQQSVFVFSMQCAEVDILLWKCSKNWDWIESILGFSSSKAKLTPKAFQWLVRWNEGSFCVNGWMCYSFQEESGELQHQQTQNIYTDRKRSMEVKFNMTRPHGHTYKLHQAQIDTHMYAMNHPKLLSTFFLSSATGNAISHHQAKVSEWDVPLKASLINCLKGLMSASGGTVKKNGQSADKIQKHVKCLRKNYCKGGTGECGQEKTPNTSHFPRTPTEKVGQGVHSFQTGK